MSHRLCDSISTHRRCRRCCGRCGVADPRGANAGAVAGAGRAGGSDAIGRSCLRPPGRRRKAGRGQSRRRTRCGQEPIRSRARTCRRRIPITAVSPAEQQKRFLLPPGYRIEPVLTEPDIEEPMQIAFDGNGRMFVLEIRGYMQDADATDELAPTGLHLGARGREQRRRLREARRLRRQAGVPALRDAVRRERDPHDGVQHGRGLEVHRHERRLRRRQEGAVHDELRAFRQRRAPAEQPVLGHGQLAVLDLQRVPRAAGRRAACSENRPPPTTRSGASPRTTTARCGSRAARAGFPATSSCRFTTA